MNKIQLSPELDLLQLPDAMAIDDDMKIYKYISVSQLLHLIETQTFPLSHVKTAWEDPNEGLLLRLFLKEADKRNPGVTESSFDIALQVHNGVFGTSWTKLDESDAMWRIYSQDRKGVRISSTVGKLKKAVSKLQAPNVESKPIYAIGKVLYSYKEYMEEYQTSHSHIIPFYFLKKQAFKHEEEVRLVLYLETKSNEKQNTKYIPIWTNFIEEVTIDPRASNWIVEATKLYCGAKGFLCNKSKLYEDPSHKK